MNASRDIAVIYIETRNPRQEIVDRCLASIPGAVVVLYSRPEHRLLRCECRVPPESMLAAQGYRAFVSQLSRFIIHDVPDQVKTSHVLFVQNDGYPINPSSWTDDFFRYDYLGAPVRWDAWLHLVPPGIPYQPFYVKDLWEVGNGGFSLRSVNLLRQCSQLMKHSFSRHDNFYGIWEDFLICKVLRPHLSGMRFGDFDIAKQFSCEQYAAFKGERPFGFHAGGNLPMVVAHEMAFL
jgi:Protein of unknown function (DUF5672)